MFNSLAKAVFFTGIGISRIVSEASNLILPYVKENSEYNAGIEVSGFIHDQTSGDVSKLKMGYHKSCYNGCGWIAAYNAALIKGLQVKPAEIIEYLEKHGGTVINGLLGANPLAVRRFFESRGIETGFVNFPRPDTLDGLIKSSTVSILHYAHKRGMHFVAIEYADDLFRIYNAYTGEDSFYCSQSIEKWVKGSDYTAISLISLK